MSVKVLSNLESLGEMIGALQGIAKGMDEDAYMEGLIKQAHGHAANAFNIAAAATAATGHFPHVFEFGTPGITPGPARFGDPTSHEARLWIHRLAGHGGSQDIFYSFRPAVVRNPQPTTESTGVSSKYLQKLSRRKYIFWNKAFVMETGMTVSNKAKNGDFLFVPFNGEAPRNPMNRKGFMMWDSRRHGALETVPGRKTKGTFTAFWLAWWAAEGQETMEREMRSSVSMDIEKAVAMAAKDSQTEAMKPVQTTNIKGVATRAYERARSLFKRNERVTVHTE